jgi:hypothetical protein
MMTVAARDAAAQTRWDHWQGRYERASRRRARYARFATAVIFAAIIANLVVQLFLRRV